MKLVVLKRLFQNSMKVFKSLMWLDVQKKKKKKKKNKRIAYDT